MQDELRYALVTGVNTPSGPFLSGGTENVAAAYARANVAVTDAFTFEVGARADSWKSEPEDPTLPTKDVSYVSPRGAMSCAPDGSSCRRRRTTPIARRASTSCIAASRSATRSPTPTRCSIRKR